MSTYSKLERACHYHYGRLWWSGSHYLYMKICGSRTTHDHRSSFAQCFCQAQHLKKSRWPRMQMQNFLHVHANMRQNSVHDSPNGLNTSHLCFSLFCRSQHRSSALSKTYPRHPLMRYGPSLSGYCFGNNGQEKDAILNEPPVKSVHVDLCFCLQNKASTIDWHCNC